MATVDFAMIYKTVIIFFTKFSNLCVNTFLKISIRSFIVNRTRNKNVSSPYEKYFSAIFLRFFRSFSDLDVIDIIRSPQE